MILAFGSSNLSSPANERCLVVIFGFKEKSRIKKNIKEAITKINNNVYNDDLWLGRFEIILNKIRFQRFED